MGSPCFSDVEKNNATQNDDEAFNLNYFVFQSGTDSEFPAIYISIIIIA